MHICDTDDDNTADRTTGRRGVRLLELALELHHPVRTFRVLLVSPSSFPSFSLNVFSVHSPIEPRGRNTRANTVLPDPQTRLDPAHAVLL